MKTYIVATVIVAMLVGMTPIAPARAVLVLGQLASNGATLDGIVVPSGTTILDPSTIATGDDPAVIHLMNGSVIAMAPHSKASFSGESGGRTSLAVETGEVVLRDETGQAILMTADSSKIIQDEGVQEGESGPATTGDADSDGILDGVDNCPQDTNADQKDSDGDGVGDVCETKGGAGFPVWAWVALGAVAAGGIYAIVDSGGSDRVASPSTTGR